VPQKFIFWVNKRLKEEKGRMENKSLAVLMLLTLLISTMAIVLPAVPVKASDGVLRVLFDQDVAWAHVKVEELTDSVKWTIDLDESSAYLNNPVAGIVVIIGIGSEIKFQVHNNDGIDPHYPYGTWLISYYDNGWHTGSPDYKNYPLPDGITATGGRSKSENPQMIFTVTIGKAYLANEFKWAVYFKGGSGGRTFYPPDFSWYDTDTSDMATAQILTLDEVWVNDDWAGYPPGYEVEPGKFIGYNAFAKVQDGINAVNEKGMVHVYAGVYAENVLIEKSITIIGEGNPLITPPEPTTYGAGIEIRANNVTFKGFTIKDTTVGHAHTHRLIRVQGDNNKIQGNTLIGRGPVPQADYLLVVASWTEIASGNIVMDNVVCNSSKVGINIGGTYKAENTVVQGNSVYDCVVGIAVDRAPNTTIYNNTVTGCSIGLYIEGREGDGRPVSGTNVTSNMIHCNDVGIQFRGANNVRVTCNTIKGNGIGVQVIAPAAGSYGTPIVQYNNIFDNTDYGAENKITEVLDARYNWWGDISGPYHPTLNPGGAGDNVSDNVNFSPWLLSEKVPPLVHDVALLDVVPSAVRVASGTTINVTVTVKNEGNAYENFTLSLYYDDNFIGSENITDMVPGSTLDLTFGWDTTGVPYGTYTLKAEASIVPGETDTADNVFIDGIVRIGPEATIKVEPSLYQAQLLNKTFNVNVTINGLWEGWRAVEVQFRLGYNETLLEVVNVTEGPFMRDPRWNRYGTSFTWFNEINHPIYGTHLVVSIRLLPNPSTGAWEVFPSGDGVLATITFRTVYQERGLEKPPQVCELKLVGTVVLDDEAEEIPLILEQGLYEMYPTHLCDVNYDGIVDIMDVTLISAAFGSSPSDGPWNPVCDINEDGCVDIIDVALVSRSFGWTFTYDP